MTIETDQPLLRLISLPELLERLGGISAVTLWRMRRDGKFPHPISISAGRKAWLVPEIDAWLADRAAARVAA